MENYNEYIEERLLGMYELLESNEIVLEATKGKVDKEKGEKALNNFVNYVKEHDPEEGAKMEKDPSRAKSAIKREYEVYRKWRDEHAALNEILVLFLFGLVGVGVQEINRRQGRKKRGEI